MTFTSETYVRYGFLVYLLRNRLCFLWLLHFPGAWQTTHAPCFHKSLEIAYFLYDFCSATSNSWMVSLLSTKELLIFLMTFAPRSKSHGHFSAHFYWNRLVFSRKVHGGGNSLFSWKSLIFHMTSALFRLRGSCNRPANCLTYPELLRMRNY